MTKHTILVCDNFGQKFLDRLRKFGKIYQSSDIDYNLPLEKVTILVVRSKTKVNKNLVDIMKNLECVITATHGIDHIDQGIAFFHGAGGHVLVIFNGVFLEQRHFGDTANSGKGTSEIMGNIIVNFHHGPQQNLDAVQHSVKCGSQSLNLFKPGFDPHPFFV